MSRAKNPHVFEKSSIQSIWKNAAQLIFIMFQTLLKKKMNRLKLKL
jgi:hypothetical protein